MALTGVETVESQKTDQVKLPRRVNFPDDESLITKVFEPQDPWKDAHRATNADLVSGYKNACEKWNVKPITKVLQQLEEIHDFSKRSEYLNLKGEKLDGKTCETLEEVFRRVRFNLVDLQGIVTDDEALVAVFEMLEYYESAIRLSLAFSRNLNSRGWQAISRLLKKSQSLEQLDLRGASIPDNCVPFLTRPIRQGTNLSVLHMENCELSGRLCLMLCSAMKANVSIRNLFLGDNKLVPADAQHLGNLLRANHRLKLLDLRNNFIQDAGLTHIAEGLMEQTGDGLLILVLWNNQLTHISMADLARSLMAVTNLETLNIGSNALGIPGILKLKEGLLKNKSILRLGLMDIKINCEGAVALAECLGDNNRMVRLDVRKNDIKTGGLMALSLSLKVHNRSVLRLDLDATIKKEPFKGYEETQRQLQEQILQSCERNKELAKNQEMRDQVLELQKLEEMKTLLRSTSVDEYLVKGPAGVEGRSSSVDEDTGGTLGSEGVVSPGDAPPSSPGDPPLSDPPFQHSAKPSPSWSQSAQPDLAVSPPEVSSQSATVSESTERIVDSSGPSQADGDSSEAQSSADTSDFAGETADDGSSGSRVTSDSSTLGDQRSESHLMGDGLPWQNGLVPELVIGSGDCGGTPIPDKSQEMLENQGLSSSPDEFEKELDQMLANATGEILGISDASEN